MDPIKENTLQNIKDKEDMEEILEDLGIN